MINYNHLEALLDLLGPVPPSSTRETLCELAVYLERMLLAALHDAFDERMRELAARTPAAQSAVPAAQGPADGTDHAPTSAMTLPDLALDTVLPGSAGITRRAMGNAEILVTYAANVASRAEEPYLRELREDELDAALNAVDEAFSVVEARAQALEAGAGVETLGVGTGGAGAMPRLSVADEIALSAVFAESREYLKAQGYTGDSLVIMNSLALQDRVLGGAA